MPTISPADSFRHFPRSPRAQFFSNRVITQAHTMMPLEKIIDQRNRSSTSSEQTYPRIKRK
jgi:hypothetical protein